MFFTRVIAQYRYLGTWADCAPKMQCTAAASTTQLTERILPELTREGNLRFLASVVVADSGASRGDLSIVSSR